MTAGQEPSFVVAVDGPSASGKGTLAKRIASQYGFAHLDTGSLYRRVGYLVLERGGDPGSEAEALAVMQDLYERAIPDEAIRTPEAGMAASKVAALPPVRSALLEYQREFAKEPPHMGEIRRGAVLDGRDIGTVVCPDAQVKLFVTASAKERARRRHAEFQAKGDPISFEDVLADIEARDERDASRDLSPMKPADDAHLLDTTDLSIEAAFQAAKRIIDERLA